MTIFIPQYVVITGLVWFEAKMLGDEFIAHDIRQFKIRCNKG